MERNKAIYLFLALASIQSGFGEDHPVNPVPQCSNNRTFLSVMKETFETVLIEVRHFLKRSEGGRRPTERSVFKFFFQKLAVL